MAQIKRCPLCQSSQCNYFWATPGYKLSSCSDCTMVWDSTPPDDLMAQYGESYFINSNPKGGYANYFEGMKINRRTFNLRLKRIKFKTRKTGRLLDVGCALGDCLLEAKKLGWRDVFGLELSAYAVKQATERKLKIRQGTLKTANFEKNSFDVVLMQDVIEHVTDPATELKRVYRILKPGGWLFLVTPDVKGFWAKILGRFWYHYKPGEHVTYFSQLTIRKALAKAGFKHVETRPTYHVMSLDYIFRRLKYYSPGFFSFLVRIAEKTSLKDFSLRVYAGELEAWAEKG